MWTLAIVLSVFATLANWPIQERAIARQQGAA